MILLLCTDMDRTLLPNGSQAVSPGAAACLRRLIEAAGLQLAYVTGRDLGRVLAAVDDYDVPVPDYIIGDVGSSLYRHDGSDWVPLAEWAAHIATDWQGRDSGQVHALIGDDPRLTAQEADRQHDYKQSYCLTSDQDQAQLQRELDERLTAAGFRSALVFSDDPEAGCVLLDVLPAAATKRNGIEFLRTMLALQNAEVMFAGDSGNDLDALVSPLPAVLVANADDGIRQRAVSESAAQGLTDALYLARGGLALAGYGTLNGCYSGGIVEGLLHYQPDLRELLVTAQ